MCESSADNRHKPQADAFDAVRARLAEARSLLLITHSRPDGDALGSMLALAGAARAAGKTVRMLIDDAVTPKYAFLFPAAQPLRAEDFPKAADEADLIVVVDTSALAQLDALADPVRQAGPKVVVIDHHATGDLSVSAAWIDPTASSAGVMVAEMLEALGWSVGPVEAEALLVAAASDTGWFHFANTDGRTLRAAAAWLDAGIRPDVLYAKLFQNARPHRLALVARMLDSLELHHGGQLAVMTIRRSDFEAAGARPDETENLVNEALQIGQVETAVLLVENEQAIRVNLRSRDAVDVAAVAAQFGGGGHRRAAGLRAETDIDDLKTRLIAACEAALTDAGL